MADKAILVVSFGTSYAETRKKTIEAIEEKIKSLYPEFDHYRAFTSRTIIRKMKEKEGIDVETPGQAMTRIAAKGYSEVYIQPLHLINGYEYDDLEEEVLSFGESFDIMGIGLPLLTIEDDYWKVIDAVTEAYEPVINDHDRQIVFMGHGTEHAAFATYPALDYMFKFKGHDNVHVATVDGFPSIEMLIENLKQYHSKKVTLIPFMLVAGDHALNDMASDEEDSWKSILETEGFEVECIIKGIGEIESVQRIYLQHIKEVIELDITEAHEEHHHESHGHQCQGDGHHTHHGHEHSEAQGGCCSKKSVEFNQAGHGHKCCGKHK